VLSILDWVAYYLIYYIEHAFILLIEGFRRTIYRLDPLLYVERFRIRKICNGKLHRATGKYFILVVFAKSSLPSFTKTLITAIKESPFNLIIVSNKQLDKLLRAELLENCCLLIERVNIGRDFGGYKDGISVLFRRFPNIERLVIANDSNFYLEKGLDRLIADLDGREDFIGVSEVFEHHYHVASFLLSFGPGVLVDPVFRKFWIRFLPISTRNWGIFKGEGKLTEILMTAGHHPHILFTADQLLPKLERLSVQEAKELVSLLPREIREKLIAILERPEVLPEVIMDDFAEAAVKKIMERNQMHAAGFLLMKFLGMPLFKRDIVYRELFTLEEVARIISKSDGQMQAEIIADIGSRPSSAQLNPIRRLLFRHWAI